MPLAGASNKQRIQRRLVAEAQTGPFYRARWSADAGEIEVVTDQDPVLPAEAIANEEDTTFGTARRNRRTFREERLSWTWILWCAFQVEVSTEAFEERLLAAPIILPRDDALGLPQVTLRFRGATPYHPPQQDPRSGTEVRFTFEAELAPA